MRVEHAASLNRERGLRHTRFIRITRDYAAGVPVQEIADCYGCSRHTVLRYARMAGLEKRPKCDAAVNQAILADYKEGMPIAEIAKKYNRSQGLVSKLAQNAGIGRYQVRE